MTKYVVLTFNNLVAEILPEFDPIFPGTPIKQRFSKEFLDATIKIEDDKEPPLNWYYDRKTERFTEPPIVEPSVLDPAPIDPLAVIAALAVDNAYRLALLELGLG